jgi:hypothetical protein
VGAAQNRRTQTPADLAIDVFWFSLSANISRSAVLSNSSSALLSLLDRRELGLEGILLGFGGPTKVFSCGNRGIDGRDAILMKEHRAGLERTLEGKCWNGFVYRKRLGSRPMTSYLDLVSLRHPQAAPASTSVLGHARPHCVGAVTTDKSPVFVGDHRFKLKTGRAMRAANGQGCVSGHRTLRVSEQRRPAHRSPEG